MNKLKPSKRDLTQIISDTKNEIKYTLSELDKLKKKLSELEEGLESDSDEDIPDDGDYITCNCCDDRIYYRHPGETIHNKDACRWYGSKNMEDCDICYDYYKKQKELVKKGEIKYIDDMRGTIKKRDWRKLNNK